MNFFHTSFNLRIINTTPQNKIVPENNAPFVNKTLKKRNYKRSALRNTFLKDASNSNWQKYRKQISKCVKIRKKNV